MEILLILAFQVLLTAFFHVFTIFVIMEISTRRIVHFNVSDHPNKSYVILTFRKRQTDVDCPS